MNRLKGNHRQWHPVDAEGLMRASLDGRTRLVERIEDGERWRQNINTKQVLIALIHRDET